MQASHRASRAAADHLVRRIDQVLDLSWVHKESAPHLSLPFMPSDVIVM